MPCTLQCLPRCIPHRICTATHFFQCRVSPGRWLSSDQTRGAQWDSNPDCAEIWVGQLLFLQAICVRPCQGWMGHCPAWIDVRVPDCRYISFQALHVRCCWLPSSFERRITDHTAQTASLSTPEGRLDHKTVKIIVRVRARSPWRGYEKEIYVLIVAQEFHFTIILGYYPYFTSNSSAIHNHFRLYLHRLVVRIRDSNYLSGGL